MKTVIVLRDCKSKRWPILAECISMGFSDVFATVAEARACLLRRFGNIEIRNLTSLEN